MDGSQGVRYLRMGAGAAALAAGSGACRFKSQMHGATE
jgi:hypothetical protein